MNTSSHKCIDPVPAGITDYQRRILIRDQARKARKSPDTSEMYSIHLPFFRVTFYQSSAQAQKRALKRLKQTYSGSEMILKQPINQ